MAHRSCSPIIHVGSDDNATSSQARPYAEYRVFSALTRYALKFRVLGPCSVQVTIAIAY
jgi:hypothetical protein